MSSFRPSARGGSIAIALRAAAVATFALLALAVSASSAGAYNSHRGIPYDLDGSTPPKKKKLTRLDLYTPAGTATTDRRPLVVYVHGGAWRAGDKRNKIGPKAKLFTDAGYLFASVNYRLSPDPVNTKYPEGRVRFPAHPADVGEAVVWLNRNVANYGGDPNRIILLGHSAGAHIASLVATDPAYVKAFQMKPERIIGVVSLDTDAYDIRRRASYGNEKTRRTIYNAFATPGEDALWDTWYNASPITWADSTDPRFLLVTQAGASARVNNSRAMAEKLGQPPETVVPLPYSHARINDALGAKDDTAGETQTVMSFIAGRVGASIAPAVKIRTKKHRRIRIRKGKRVRVVFRFHAPRPAVGYQCRIGSKSKFRRCNSPKAYKLKRGKYRFAVRALAGNGTTGPVSAARVKVKRKRG